MLDRMRRRLALLICPELGKGARTDGGMSADALLALANLYGAHRGLTLSTVSTYAAADGKFFAQLGRGASCTIRKADRVAQWFSDNWPADLEWPRAIPRPPRTKREAA